MYSYITQFPQTNKPKYADDVVIVCLEFWIVKLKFKAFSRIDYYACTCNMCDC